jgi:hypothetical protein
MKCLYSFEDLRPLQISHGVVGLILIVFQHRLGTDGRMRIKTEHPGSCGLVLAFHTCYNNDIARVV